jgi:hypothetical protein
MAFLAKERTKLSEKPAWSGICDPSHAASDCCRADAFAKMTEADKLVQLFVTEFEEPFGFSIAVIFHSGRPQNGISERNGDRGVVTPQGKPICDRLILCLVKRLQKRSGAAFETFGPAFNAFAPCQFKGLYARADFRNCFQLLQCMLFHSGLLSSEK